MVGQVMAPDEVAAKLGLVLEDSVVVRRRTMFVDETPYQLADTYYPTDIAAGTVLEQPAKLRGGEEVVLKQLGYPPDRHVEEVSVRMPTAEQRRALNINGIPLLRLLRTTYAVGGRPISVMENFLVGDRNGLRYELPSQRT
jgi:GntR family transcriptional regulator